jgi:hypothetical protein
MSHHHYMTILTAVLLPGIAVLVVSKGLPTRVSHHIRLEPSVAHRLKELWAFYRSRGFITAVTRRHHWSHLQYFCIQSTPLYPISHSTVLILSLYTLLCLPEGLASSYARRNLLDFITPKDLAYSTSREAPHSNFLQTSCCLLPIKTRYTLHSILLFVLFRWSGRPSFELVHCYLHKLELVASGCWCCLSSDFTRLTECVCVVTRVSSPADDNTLIEHQASYHLAGNAWTRSTSWTQRPLALLHDNKGSCRSSHAEAPDECGNSEHSSALRMGR